MKTRLLYLLLAACLTGASFAMTVGSAAADLFSVTYLDADGERVTVSVDAPDSGSAAAQTDGNVQSVTRIGAGKAAAAPTTSSDATTSSGSGDGTTSTTPAPGQTGADDNAGSVEKSLLSDPPSIDKARPKAERRQRSAGRDAPSVQRRRSSGGGTSGGGGTSPTPMRQRGGAPTRSNPTFVDGLPGPARSTGVPNFVIRKFRVPPFLLPIYQAAGIQYGIRWEVLAAVNEIETDYGRNLNVSSAGALGWMQFMPATWKMYGTDGNQDGDADPFNPVDAIFTAARYLKAAGGDDNIKKGLFAYNHADWYVDSVMMRARLIAGVPSDVVGSLTGLTEGRFPVADRARYADDLAERDAEKTIRGGKNAARLVNSLDSRRNINIYARRGAPAVAVNDGIIKKIGRSKAGGSYVVLQDVYGNRYTYSGLDSVSRYYPVPKDEGRVSVTDDAPGKDPRPGSAASAGRQQDGRPAARRAAGSGPAPAAAPKVIIKERLFAHPMRPNARRAGGAAQVKGGATPAGAPSLKGFTSFRNYFSRPIGLNASDMRLKPMRVGARVIGGTIIGRIGKPDAKAAHLTFEIRPAGRGAPRIDPKPILDGWKLLEATAVYRASGRNALFGADGDSFSIGQVLLLPKPLLEKRVLSDERINVYPCGQRDVRSGQIDRRVLATMAYLAEAGLRPTVTSLKCGHGTYTSSGNVSEHSSGNAVDVAKVNGVPIIGHQDRGGIAEQAVKRLMQLQGTMRADQIISLLDLGGNTLAMSDHNDHIHVGFRPLFGDNRKQGAEALAVLRPGQWDDLLGRLRRIDNPVVRVGKSKYSIPVRKRRGSRAHRGE
jgi:hypothetical protein